MARGVRGIKLDVLDRLARLPGTARRYRDPITGREYSRREVQTAKIGVSPESAARATKLAKIGVFPFEENVEHLYQSYRYRLRLEGKTITKRQAFREGSEFLQAIQDMITSKSKSPTGKKAKALVALGLRPKGARYRVGESPKTMKSPYRKMKSRRERVRGRR